VINGHDAIHAQLKQAEWPNANKMKNVNERYVEELYYRADELLNMGEIAEAKEVLHDVLLEDPLHALAHNALGWIYTHHLLNYDLAETHLKLSMKHGNGVVVAYSNYAYLLFHTSRYHVVRDFVDSSLVVPGVDEAYLLQLKALTYEVEGRYIKALRILKKAKRHAFAEDFVNRLNANVSRINLKMRTTSIFMW